jgi:hypothetical protein
MEDRARGTLIARQTFMSNEYVIKMMQEDDHTKSIFMDYAKQSIMSLTYDDQGSVAHPSAFCPDFTALSREMGYGTPASGQLQSIGRKVAKKFREDFQTAPQIVQKYVACAIRSVKTYPISNLAWIKIIVTQVMKA